MGYSEQLKMKNDYKENIQVKEQAEDLQAESAKHNILLCTDGFPFGDSERGFLSCESAVLAQKYNLSVLARCNDDDKLIHPLEGIKQAEQIKFIPLRAEKDLFVLLRMIRPLFFKEIILALKHGKGRVITILKAALYQICYVVQAYDAIKKLIKRENIDLIYTYWCNYFTVAAALLKRKFPGLKVVTRFHGYDLYNERSKIQWQMFRELIGKTADGLVFVSDFGRQYFLTTWGRKWAEKCQLSYLGCEELKMVKPNQGDKLCLVSCSYVIPLKRIHLIAEGLAYLPSDIKVKWYHIGDGSQRAEILNLTEKLFHDKPAITFNYLGFILHEKINEVYREIGPDLFITTSETEGGAPVSIQEAFSAGIPAIGTAVGGIPEIIIDGRTGFLLSQNPDAAEVSEAIKRYYNLSPKEKEAMRLEAHKMWEEKFNAGANAQKFADFLDKMLR